MLPAGLRYPSGIAFGCFPVYPGEHAFKESRDCHTGSKELKQKRELITMIFSRKRLCRRKRLTSLVLSLVLAATSAAGCITASASPEAAAAGVYVKQMGRGYCTLASAVDMMRSKMYISGNPSWPNVTQQAAKSTAWLNGGGLYHNFTYYGMTVTYSTAKCNTAGALISLLEQHPEGIEIYIRDLPHAVLLTRYDASTGTFYVADPVYDGERTLMQSWQRKAGSTQAAVIGTIDAFWYISSYQNQTVPGGLRGPVAPVNESGTENNDAGNVNENPVTPEPVPEPIPEPPAIIDDEDYSNMNVNQPGEAVITDSDCFAAVRSTVKLPYIYNYASTAFTDVDNASWYRQSVQAAYEMGMMNGVSSSQFLVYGNVTLAQTICMAARIRSLYYADGYDFTAVNGEPWYLPYVRYARENHMLDAAFDAEISTGLDYDKVAQRIEFAQILSRALPDDQLTAIRQTDSISDVPDNSGEERYEAVYQLYDAGVLTGDGEGFKPWNTITRAEVAAVVSRMGDASLRIG